MAPDFEGKVFGGDVIKLSSLRGKKVWLGFYRFSSCFFCNLRIAEEIEWLNKNPLRKNLTKIAIFQSPEANIDIGVGKQKPPFPIIADPEMKLYKEYGVTHSLFAVLDFSISTMRRMKEGKKRFGPPSPDGPVTRQPADFLINEQGIIVDVFYAKKISQHIPLENIDAFIGIMNKDDKRAA